MAEEPVTVDFETKKIDKRPAYPPEPAGVAIRWAGGKQEYLAWGHPYGNNATVEQGRTALKQAFGHSGGVLFQNASFDIEVANAAFGLRPQYGFDDTLYMAFLHNPYERTLSLKPMAEKYLGMPPEERDEVKDWILDNVPECKRKKSEWGAYIASAPPSIVGPYAIGDVDRTYKLYKHFMPNIKKRGMYDAYKREVDLTGITTAMEQSGIRVDLPGLHKLCDVFTKLDAKLVNMIHRKLGIGKNTMNVSGKPFNVNSGAQLASALLAANKLDAVIKTKTGKVSTKIANLNSSCNDKELLRLLSVHSVAEKYLSTFIKPWIEQASRTGGRILPRFNQVRGDGGGGARTGRYSSSDPNMQNVSANVEESSNREVLEYLQKLLLEWYECKFIGLRDYLLPDEGSVMICTDYSQQELRIFAHFENDVLAKAYLKDPSMDVHEFCRQLVHDATGVMYERKHIKITVFGILYGMGVGKLADRLKVDNKTARSVRDGIYKAIPGIPQLMKKLKYQADRDKPITTWGGREYFCEDPYYDKESGDWWSFEYKLLNYLIQASAADCTKQGMINVREQVPDARIAIQVHDELVCMAPDESYGPRIAHAMCDMPFKVPMMAEPKYTRQSWARAK